MESNSSVNSTTVFLLHSAQIQLKSGVAADEVYVRIPNVVKRAESEAIGKLVEASRLLVLSDLHDELDDQVVAAIAASILPGVDLPAVSASLQPAVAASLQAAVDGASPTGVAEGGLNWADIAAAVSVALAIVVHFLLDDSVVMKRNHGLSVIFGMAGSLCFMHGDPVKNLKRLIEIVKHRIPIYHGR